MTFRRMTIAAASVCLVLGAAHAASSETPAPYRPEASSSPVPASVAGYRDYVKTQADTLVGMTKVLAKAIKHGDVEAAQSTYAPAHRYLKRIEPIARAFRELDKRMDAHADDYEKQETDPAFSGFHRIEYGLFANRSTAGLSDHADRLYEDARELRDQLMHLEAAPSLLIDGVVASLKQAADKGLAGKEERYSKTDLWDLEANVDGAQQVVELLKPQARVENAKTLAHTAIYFTQINELLGKYKAGCGFKNSDELAEKDKMALKRPIVSLAEELATLRGKLAMD